MRARPAQAQAQAIPTDIPTDIPTTSTASKKPKPSPGLQRRNTSESTRIQPQPQPGLQRTLTSDTTTSNSKTTSTNTTSQNNNNKVVDVSLKNKLDASEKRRISSRRRLAAEHRSSSDRSITHNHTGGMDNSQNSHKSLASVRTHLSQKEMKVRDERVRAVEDSFASHKRASLQRQLSDKLIQEQQEKLQEMEEEEIRQARQEEEDARRAFDTKKKQRYSRSKQVKAKQQENQQQQDKQKEPPQPRRSSMKKSIQVHQQSSEVSPKNHQHLQEHMEQKKQKQSQFQQMKIKQLQEQSFQQQLQKGHQLKQEEQKRRQQAFIQQQTQQHLLDDSSSSSSSSDDESDDDSDESSGSSASGAEETTTEGSNKNDNNDNNNDKSQKKKREQFLDEEDDICSDIRLSDDSSDNSSSLSSSIGTTTSSGDAGSSSSSSESSSSSGAEKKKVAPQTKQLQSSSRSRRRRRTDDDNSSKRRIMSSSSGAHTFRSVSSSVAPSHASGGEVSDSSKQQQQQQQPGGDSSNNNQPYHHGRSLYGRNLTNFPKPTNAALALKRVPTNTNNNNNTTNNNKCSIADKEERERFWRAFLTSPKFKVRALVLLAIGVGIVVGLVNFAIGRTVEANPQWKFQHHAVIALNETAHRLQSTTKAVHDLAYNLQQELLAANVSWPLVTAQNLKRHALTLAHYKHIRSVIVAPLVAPKQWKRFQQYADRVLDQQQDYIDSLPPKKQQRYQNVFLRWDASKFEEPGDLEETIFVPWQQSQTNPKQYYARPAYSNAKIVQDWYDYDEQEDDDVEGVWESISRGRTRNETNSAANNNNPVLMLRRPTASELAARNGTASSSSAKNFDYLLQPMVGTVVVEKRLLRPNRFEQQVVALLAVQLRWDLMLQDALGSAFASLFPPEGTSGNQNELSNTHVAVVAELQDRCTGATIRRYNVPIPHARPEGDRRRMPPSRSIVATEGRDQMQDDSSLLGAMVEENIDPADSSSIPTETRCPKATFWKLLLYPTDGLNDALVEHDWELYEIIMTWLLLYSFVCAVVFYRLYESKLNEEIQEQHWQEEMENEEVDPDEVASAVTVLVMDIAGWQEWAATKTPSEVVCFITSLLHATDQLAKEHKVVKVKTVGSSMVYASGRPKHALALARFVRDVVVSFQQWTAELEPTYGPGTLELKLKGALETGTLDRRLLIRQGSKVNGNAIHKASLLEESCTGGQILMSSQFAHTLRQYGRAKWIQPSEKNPETFYMVFNAVSKLRDGSGHSSRRLMKDGSVHSTRRLSGHSARNLLSGSNHSRRTLDRSGFNQSKRSLASASIQLSKVPGDQDLPKRSDSPPPLAGMEQTGEHHPPPIELIDVSNSDMDDVEYGEESSSNPSATALDLGYEEMEPRTFNHDDEDDEYESDEDEDYDDDVSNASLEQKQMVLEMAQKKERLIEWSIDLLTRCLEEILAARTTQNSMKALASVEDQLGTGSNILEQCKEFISIPIFSQSELRERKQPGSIPMTDAASKQLRDYVTKIADSYSDHAFHNFEHAANVTACLRKMYNKLMGSEFTRRRSSNKAGIMNEHSGRSLFSSISVGHSTSYGIKTDPLIKFSIIFCALIHDADHPGVPNQLLIDENSPMAAVYKKKSIAEQNSVEFSWSLLMRPEYVDLRAAIYCNEKEIKRFRQVIVNCVLATDLHDPDLQTLRKARWAKAFAEEGQAVATAKPTKRGPRRGNTKSMDYPRKRQPPGAAASNSMLDALRQAATQASMSLSSRPKDDINRKGTIVLEHLLQAADISHTMQNWKVYLKWNERLFDEFFETFESGRSGLDPATTWYQGELDFFDFIVIPLAKKLSSCGIFEEAGEELLENAISNRQEWESKGHEVLQVYVAHYRESHVHHVQQQARDNGENSEIAVEGVETLESARPGQRDSNGTLMALSRRSTASSLTPIRSSEDQDENASTTGTTEKQMQDSQLGLKLALLPDAAPDAAAIGNASVADTLSDDDDGDTNSQFPDLDIVYAVLENADDPDDFFSYTLLTPKQLRKRKERQEKQENVTLGSKDVMRERRRRIRRQTGASAVASAGFGVAGRRISRGNSFHSRSSFISLNSDVSEVQVDGDTPIKRQTTMF
ncbi:inhibited 3',5'-cyclic phosphodiesterase B [Seminavis robusta]|uniref:Inhibited 3',5'-cyclic phosphodiesterase B n=1 Tax=Seminavis robusta TaxID=568900 RepID=A0A9N8E941_9STRA|nr:inhibited 3',5'-cyclic phosphodiesterase B [Seminavis robusta]|eukprot:Sro629_g178170.1 inhibited 3',5'-cyclic phosphodiesterase B (2101) ;mRNA; f:13819-20862